MSVDWSQTDSEEGDGESETGYAYIRTTVLEGNLWSTGVGPIDPKVLLPDESGATEHTLSLVPWDAEKPLLKGCKMTITVRVEPLP